MRGRRERLVGLAEGLVATAAFTVSELVIWSGQPGDGASGADVVRYYGDHGVRVRLGDLVWTIGAVLLVLASVVVGRSMARGFRRWFVGATVTAAALLVASAVVAVVLTMQASTVQAGTAHTLWWTEGLLFTIGARLLAVPLLAAAMALFGRGTAATSLAVVAAVLAVEALAQLLVPWGLLATSAWMGVAAGLIGGESEAAPRVHRIPIRPERPAGEAAA